MKKQIKTGTLTLNVERNMTGMKEEELFDIAARANPKRGFLIVSSLIGRHVPTRPKVLRHTASELANLIGKNLPQPVVFLGMAETAVGLGQAVHSAWCAQAGEKAWFIQSTRQTHEEMSVWAQFEEGHSHATSHLVHVPDDKEIFAAAKTLIIVDDECSTGKTFIKVEDAMREVMPNLEKVVDVVITDWAGDTTRERVSLVSGTLGWDPNGVIEEVPGQNANAHGKTKKGKSPGRTGYQVANRQIDNLIDVKAGERITVLSDGENSYDALLVAEALEAVGAIAAVQSITRSPAHIGGALKERAIFSDAHGSGATCYSYNLGAHSPDRYVIVVEEVAQQGVELAKQTGMDLDKIHVLQLGTEEGKKA